MKTEALTNRTDLNTTDYYILSDVDGWEECVVENERMRTRLREDKGVDILKPFKLSIVGDGDWGYVDGAFIISQDEKEFFSKVIDLEEPAEELEEGDALIVTVGNARYSLTPDNAGEVVKALLIEARARLNSAPQDPLNTKQDYIDWMNDLSQDSLKQHIRGFLDKDDKILVVHYDTGSAIISSRGVAEFTYLANWATMDFQSTYYNDWDFSNPSVINDWEDIHVVNILCKDGGKSYEV